MIGSYFPGLPLTPTTVTRGNASVRAVRLFGAVIAALALLSACTSSGGKGPTASPSVQTQTVTQTTTPAPGPTAPISTGPTTSATASDCPYLSRSVATPRSGMRLDRITVLHSGGKIVGCRFYGLQHPNASCSESCLAGERLPPASQPAIEMKIVRYPSANAAHNALATRFTSAGSIEQDKIGSDTGLCFETDFYAKDKGTDWACAFTLDTRLIIVRTVITKGALSALAVARAFAKNL
jgi:hypothetical protein